MSISYSTKVAVPADVLIQELDEGAALLNLATQKYFGLDEMGLRIWKLLESSDSIQEVYDTLLGEYDVKPETLRQELDALLGRLTEHRLVQVGGEGSGDAEA